MKDKFGTDIEVGDRVVVAHVHYGFPVLYVGKVTRIGEKSGRFCVFYEGKDGSKYATTKANNVLVVGKVVRQLQQNLIQ